MISTKYQRRTYIIFGLFCFLYAVIAANVYRLSIVQHDFYTNLGTQQYTLTVTQLPPRAHIVDRNNVPLALNKEALSAFIMPHQLQQKEKLVPFLQKNFPESYNRIQHKKDTHFIYVGRRLTTQQQELLQPFKDIKCIQEQSRYYPQSACSILVGCTDIDNKGMCGIEYTYDKQLSGTPRTYELEKDARSGHFYFAKEEKSQGSQSEPIQLTIDSTLQFLAHEELAHTIKQHQALEGGLIIMNPKNGDILAMSCIPHFDPNDQAHLNIEHTKNCVISNTYEFGSINKVIVAMAALEEGLTTPEELIDCKNSKTTFLDGRKINTWKEDGVIPFKQVIAASNNIGIALIAKRLQATLYEHYIRLGFGKKTGITLPGEAKGFVNHPANWSKQSLISLSYGYEVASTLLQEVSLFCLIAHQGHSVKPRILMAEPISIGRKKYSDATITAIQDILQETTLHGTAYRANIKGYRVMSKTGSAHMLTNGQYDENKNIYSCIGIVEKGDYQRVIGVYLIKQGDKQKNVFASNTAAPLLEHIAQRMLIHEKIIH